MNGLMEDEKVKEYILIDICVQIGLVVIIVIADILIDYGIIVFSRINQMKTMLFVISIIVNCIIGYLLIKYISRKLDGFNLKITEAMNDNYNISIATEYKEGLLYSIDNQLKMLITRLFNNKEVLKKEQKRLHSLVTEIAHQLKTPVSATKLFISLLEDKNIENNEKEKIMQKMEDEINRIEWFTNSLTNISKLETGLIQLNIVNQNITNTIIYSINSVYIKAQEKNIQIHTKNLEYRNILFKHDIKWTQEAIINILDNAVKYTNNNGEIIIELIITDVINKIIISDTGMGIAKKDMPFIFDRFYKSDNSGEGVGIGLYLAKQIMIKQGGTIKAKSQIGVGTRFEMIFYM